MEVDVLPAVGLAGDQLAAAGERLSVTDALARYASSSSSPVARRLGVKVPATS